ncbi:MAG: AMP-binding protein [Cyanobacteria bacterium]|nr:AMP-binding protein [Cyanobacteriota bacterium]
MSKEKLGYITGKSANNNVIAFLHRHAETIPSKAAFLADSNTKNESPLSYLELWQQIQSTAYGLHRLGIQRGERVLIFIPMSSNLYVAMFAVQMLGAIAVFLDSWARSDQLGMCAAQASPVAFIAPEKAFAYTDHLPELDCLRYKIVTGPHQDNYSAQLETLAQEGNTHPIAAVNQEDTALITFTTGSSGPPKGADRTHRFLCAQHYALETCLPYQPDDIDLPVFPIFSLNNLAGGVTTVLPEIDLAKAQDHDGAILIRQIQDRNTTCCTLSPSLLRKVTQAAFDQSITLNGLRRVATGGAPINSDDVARFKKVAPHAELHILYGSTEVEPIAHLLTDYMPDETEHDGVCVGTLAAGLEHKLLKLEKNPITLGLNGWQSWEVATGEVGELAVSGEHVCRGYYNNPDAFSNTKILDPDGRIWHRTGDLCFFDSQNRLWVAGRLHNVIVRNNTYLFPVKPEVVMNRLPFVKVSAYLGLPDKHLGELALAAFSIKDNTPENDAIERVREALTVEGIPVDKILVVNDIPLDPRHHSKVEYAKLRESILAESVSSRTVG